MIKLSKLYTYFFFTITILCFIVGGGVQFFIGIPNIIYTYGVLSLFFITYVIYVAIKKKIFFNKVVALHLVLILLILTSALLNKTNPIKVLIYLIFIFVPLGSYLFFKINHKEQYISKLAISRLFLIIALVQLPVILIQNIGFDFFINFNRSGQEIASFDFMFGTFFLKADHSLGFFLLLNIINVYKNNDNKSLTKYPKLVLFYLVATVFFAESNITKLLLGVFILYMAYDFFPKRIKIIGFISVIILLIFGWSRIKEFRAIERQLYFIEKEYNVEKSYRNYERGIAKRPQVVISYMAKFPLKIIGDGPYSYFDVLKGKFAQTKHFSQLIWTYADLGIIGLIVVIMLLYALTASLGMPKKLTYLVFTVILIYAFMTTILSDIALMIIFNALLQNKKENS